MGGPRRGARVRGPYAHRGKWQLHIVDEFGGTSVATYDDKATAEFEKARIRKDLPTEGLTVADALRAYREQAEKRKRRPRGTGTLVSAVRKLVGDEGMLLCDVSRRFLEKRIDARLSSRRHGKDEAGHISPVTVASELRQTKRFLRWCSERGLCRLPARLEALRVEAEGEGKEQLSIDEARAFLTTAAEMADVGDLGAKCAAAVLLLGVRARELLERTVRDLDDGGRVLWIKRAKTKRGNRKVRVPEPVRSWLLQLADGRATTGYLIPGVRNGRPRSSSWLRKEVARICDEAQVTVVCTHGLRGTHSTIAEEAGVVT